VKDFSDFNFRFRIYQAITGLRLRIDTEKHSTFISNSIIDHLHGLSGLYPYTYLGIIDPDFPYASVYGYPEQLFLGIEKIVTINPFYTSIYKLSNIIYPEVYNYLSGRLFYINSASVGCPVFMSAFDHNADDDCTYLGLVGLVSGVLNSFENNKDDVYLGIYYLPVVLPPNSFSVKDVLDYARMFCSNGVCQDSAFSYLLDRVRSANRAMSSLISAGVLSGIAFAAVLVVDWYDVDQIIRDSEVYVKKLKEIYDEVLGIVSSCIDSLPNLTRNEKIIYVQQCSEDLNYLMATVNATGEKNEIKMYLLDKMGNYCSRYNLYPCPQGEDSEEE